MVASSEPDQAQALLRPIYGNALCVVRSRWTPEQVEGVRAALHQHWDDWTICEFGNRTDQDAQVVVSAKVVHVAPGLVLWGQSLPTGILEVVPWLQPNAP